MIKTHPELEGDLGRVCRELADRCDCLEVRAEDFDSTDFASSTACSGCTAPNSPTATFSASVGLGFPLGPGGEVLYRVKDAAIAGNFYELVRDSLVALSAESRRSYSGSSLLPWALAANVAVT